jgi:hypothetical protein
MLDIECFTYLNRALESPLSPHVILATNRGLSTIRGTESEPGGSGSGIQAPHGVPLDLLDRCMIVRTYPLVREEIKTVLGIRAKVEGLGITEEALERLADEGGRSSMRFVVVPCYRWSLSSIGLVCGWEGEEEKEGRLISHRAVSLLVSVLQICPPTPITSIHSRPPGRPDRDRDRRYRSDERTLPGC